MPVIEGEKYACTSCIKGHRVSGCTHTDRELHHINPKGRPVKQCEHCRGARKSKSHHAKCDCGEKKDKGGLKDKGDAKVNEGRCCCHSGAKCICGVTKDSLDLKLDTGKHTLHAARAKPKLTSTQSESTLTVFANRHHKPCHRNNNTAHVSGAPYKLGRPHTLHGSAAFASLGQGNSVARSDAPAQRSMDTLSVSNNDYYAMFGSTQRLVDSLPIMPLTGSLDTSDFQDSLFASQGSAFVHEGNSPVESQLSEAIPAPQWPWANDLGSLNRNFGYGSLSTSPSQDCLPNLDNEWAIPSAGLTNPSWLPDDLPLDPSKLNNTMAQPISHSGDSNKQSNPGLTASSSSHSDIGESALFGDLDLNKNPQSAASETLFWEDSPAFRFTPSAPNEIRPAPTSIPPYVEDSQPAKQVSTLPTTLATSSSDSVTSYSAADLNDGCTIAIPNNMDDVFSNNAWSTEQSNGIFGEPNSYMTFQNSNWI